MDAKLLWTPSEDLKHNANITHYINWLIATHDLSFSDYDELWQWSVDHPDEFWESLWQYFDILHDGNYTNVVTGTMPHAKWFEGTSLNYAEHVFRKRNDAQPAIIFSKENGAIENISWASLYEQVASVQSLLVEAGIKKGDTVAAYLPCIPEATIAFLAVNSIGAIWSSCSPDFGTASVIDRFAQIKPKVLFATDHYNYGRKIIQQDRRD